MGSRVGEAKPQTCSNSTQLPRKSHSEQKNVELSGDGIWSVLDAVSHPQTLAGSH